MLIFQDGSSMQNQGYVRVSSMGVVLATIIILKASQNVKRNVEVSREILFLFNCSIDKTRFSNDFTVISVKGTWLLQTTV